MTALQKADSFIHTAGRQLTFASAIKETRHPTDITFTFENEGAVASVRFFKDSVTFTAAKPDGTTQTSEHKIIRISSHELVEKVKDVLYA